MSKKALLIGAGFSYDLGMPLAKELTKDFFHFLNPVRMQKYINLWKNADPFGPERPIDPDIMDEVFDIYRVYQDNSNSNYEEFLKEIQVRHHELGAKQDRRDTLYFAFGKFFDMIYQMFWMYQVNNLAIYEANRKYYEAFSNFVSDEEVWVLSLNHDLFVEFLCFENQIPLSFGSIGEVAFPESNNNMSTSVVFGQIHRRDTELEKMNFIRNNRGVNLIKLHGAINEFSYDNDQYMIFIKIEEKETPITYLSKVNKVLHEVHYYLNEKPVILGSEIAVSDFNGKMQFLRKSILTGGYKYSETFDPKPGEEKIRLMEEVLSIVDELTIIGYSFGDKHVNLRLYNAMLLNKNMKIRIVSPSYRGVPEILKPFDYNLRVRGASCGAPEWLKYIENDKWDMTQLEELKNMRALRQFKNEEYRKSYLSPKIK